MDYFVISFINPDNEQCFVHRKLCLEYYVNPFSKEIDENCMIAGYYQTTTLIRFWNEQNAWVPEKNFDLEHIVINKIEFKLKPVAFPQINKGV